MITIKDIAKLAGVSHTAVSQVMNNKGRVSEDKRNEILNLCKTHNYLPNFSARGLQSKKTRVIGVIVNFLGNPFFSEIIKGIENIALENSYVLLFGDSREDPARESMYVDTFIGRRVDGIIMYPTFSKEFEKDLLKLNNFNIPYILVDKYSENIQTNFAGCNDFEIGFIGTNHLIKLGHKDIGFIGGPSCSSMNARLDGYMKALKNASLEYNKNYYASFSISKDNNLINGYEPALNLLSHQKKLTALFSSTDEVIPGIMRALRELNLKVPQDIAIVSSGNIDGLINEEIPITSVNYPQVEVGEEAVKILIRLIENENRSEKLQQVFLKPELVVRQSCGADISEKH